MTSVIDINDRYIIRHPEKNILGRGGMGVVYRGEDTQAGRLVAVKQLHEEFLHGNPEIVERFIREGKVLRQLDHPNIVHLLDAVTIGRQHYLIMEYVSGGSLRDLLEKKAQRPLSQIIQIGLELADALTRAHHLEIVHRDLKPANVLLTADGIPRLTDFGMAHMTFSPRITQSGILIGTPTYLSPEACRGETVDSRADIWAFGVLLYEMVTGEVPFDGSSLPDLLIAIAAQPVPSIETLRPDCDPYLAALIYSLLVRDPKARIGTIRQVAAQLEAIQRGQPLSAPTLFIKRPTNQMGSSLQAHHRHTLEILSAARYQIDNRFVKLTLLLDQGPNASNMRFIEDQKQRQYDDLEELLGDIEESVVVVLGQPGSGKTTLLRRLQFSLTKIELKTSGGLIAFFVPLNGYYVRQPNDPPPDPTIWLAEQWRKQHPDLPDFTTLLRQGRLYLLLDGLNEMPHRDKANYRELIGRWRQFLQEISRYDNRVVFSCRSLDYSAPLGAAAPVRQVRVEPLSLPQIKNFLRAYLPERGEIVWRRLQRDEKRLSLFSNPFFLRLLVTQIGDQDELPSSGAALLTGFIRRTLRREITEQTHRLFQPGALLSDGDYEQALHNLWLTPYDLPWEGALFTQLERLAFAMQDSRDSTEAGQARILEQEAFRLLDHPQAGEIIQAGIQLNILEKEIVTRELFFTHQLFQEYFAARLLTQTPDPAKVAVDWQIDKIQPPLAETLAGLEKSEPLPPTPATGWEETTVLAAAMSKNQELFARRLMPLNLPLAGRCAAMAEVKLSASFTGEIQQALINRIEQPHADLRARIAAANSLGNLGDPRFEFCAGSHSPYLRPPTVLIPSGIYPMGCDEAVVEDAIAAKWAEFEKPAHTVAVTAFEIGVFPVTNAEYKLFWKGGGYKDERWWLTEASRTWLRKGGREAEIQTRREARLYWQSVTEDEIKSRLTTSEATKFRLWLRNASTQEFEAWLFEEYPAAILYSRPHYWDNSRFNQPTQPVVGVTWFEALAYCAWLSAQSGELYDLPTEAEWEAAARGVKGRIHPFGDTFNTARCNTFETHIRATTPVSVFPTGKTEEGVFDFSGNVWEWTTSLWGKRLQTPDYLYPYDAADGRECREEANLRRVMRGGSWKDYGGFARTTARNGGHPDHRLNDYGFRIVARRPLSQER